MSHSINSLSNRGADLFFTCLIRCFTFFSEQALLSLDVTNHQCFATDKSNIFETADLDFDYMDQTGTPVFKDHSIEDILVYKGTLDAHIYCFMVTSCKVND